MQPRRERPHREAEDRPLFEGVRSRLEGKDVCFLCGVTLGGGNRTREHVFPRWLLERFNLWDQELNLLNGTRIRYRQLTIPACGVCNARHLGRVEEAVADASNRGIEAVESLDRDLIFNWLAKILYGVLYKERFLAIDRRTGSPETIVTDDLLEEFQMHHFFLQSCRRAMSFDGFHPASIFTFKTQFHAESESNFDFLDSPRTLTIGIRMGDVGVVAVLQDGGAQERLFGDFYSQFKDHALSEHEFRELFALVQYRATTFERTPKYMVMTNADPIQVIQLPLQGFTTKPLFRDVNLADYAQMLAYYMNVPVEAVFNPPDEILSWLNYREDD
jgi:hypothetical protein